MPTTASAPGPHESSYTRSPATRSNNAIDAAAASKTPAAERTIDSSTRRFSSRARGAGSRRSPRAPANASTDGNRRYGSGSRPARTASATIRSTPSASSQSSVGSRNRGGLPTTSVHSVRPNRTRPCAAKSAARQHLGRYEPRRADRARRAAAGAAHIPRDAEVDEHDAALAENDVGRLDVAVHDLLRMHVGQRLAQLAHVLERLGDRQRPRWSRTRARLGPRTSSITRQRRAPCERSSSTRATRGWRRRDKRRASLSKRAAWRSSCDSLSATSAPSESRRPW